MLEHIRKMKYGLLLLPVTDLGTALRYVVICHLRTIYEYYSHTLSNLETFFGEMHQWCL